MTEHRYIQPTSAMRAKLIGASLAAVGVSIAFERWVSPRLAWVASLPTCESLPWVRLELVTGVLICWFIGYMALKHGLATWRCGQTPLPNTWVWSRTRIRTGKYAKFAAIAALAMSAIFLVGPVFLIVWQKFYLIFCIPESCGCA